MPLRELSILIFSVCVSYVEAGRPPRWLCHARAAIDPELTEVSASVGRKQNAASCLMNRTRDATRPTSRANASLDMKQNESATSILQVAGRSEVSKAAALMASLDTTGPVWTGTAGHSNGWVLPGVRSLTNAAEAVKSLGETGGKVVGIVSSIEPTAIIKQVRGK